MNSPAASAGRDGKKEKEGEEKDGRRGENCGREETEAEERVKKNTKAAKEKYRRKRHQ